MIYVSRAVLPEPKLQGAERLRSLSALDAGPGRMQRVGKPALGHLAFRWASLGSSPVHFCLIPFCNVLQGIFVGFTWFWTGTAAFSAAQIACYPNAVLLSIQAQASCNHSNHRCSSIVGYHVVTGRRWRLHCRCTGSMGDRQVATDVFVALLFMASCFQDHVLFLCHICKPESLEPF